MLDSSLKYIWSGSFIGGDFLIVSSRFQDILEGLRAMGHTMVQTSSFAAAQGILRKPGGGFYAQSDPRKRGYPAGY